MNLVMSDITRNKLGCYMAQQASLNNIPVSALVSRFTVEPAVQQRFENASKESTEFTKRINVIGVTDQKGEKILLDTTGPIARTNTSYDGTKRRNPNNVVDLKNRKYQCEQVNYDTFISYTTASPPKRAIELLEQRRLQRLNNEDNSHAEN